MSKETIHNAEENINQDVNGQTEPNQNEPAGHTAEEKKPTPAKRKNSKSFKDKEIKELKEKIDEQQDKFLRLFSEFDNFRKRTAREKLELSKTASENLITDLLPVLDDFDRALDSLNEESSKEALEGVRLIRSKFWKVLERQGLEYMDSKGKDFDTDFHEALTNIPAPDENLKGKVVEVVEKGYVLGGKVIRYAKVVVGQ